VNICLLPGQKFSTNTRIVVIKEIGKLTFDSVRVWGEQTAQISISANQGIGLPKGCGSGHIVSHTPVIPKPLLIVHSPNPACHAIHKPASGS
jgi:hypothetical protein